MVFKISPGGGLYCGPGFRLLVGLRYLPIWEPKLQRPQVFRSNHCPYRDNLKGANLVEKWCNQSTTSLEKSMVPTSIEFDVYRAQDAAPGSSQSNLCINAMLLSKWGLYPQSAWAPTACCAASEAGELRHYHT